MNKFIILMLLISTGINSSLAVTDIIGSGFSYQGELLDGEIPATGSYDIIIDAYNSEAGNSMVGTQTFIAVDVSAGLFTIEEVDFGTLLYNGDEVWLEISIRPSGVGSYTMLNSRQRISASPYAVKAQYLAANGASNGNVLQFNGSDWVAASINVISPWNAVGVTSSIEHSGNVGINVANPFTPLHVASTGSGDVAILDAPSNTQLSIWEGGVQRGYVGSTLAAGGNINDSDFDIGTLDSNATGVLHLTIKKAPMLTIDIDGKVGIGTTSPSHRLHVTSETGDDPVRVQVNGSTKFKVEANGSATIGANFGSTPSNGLYVQGNTVQNESSMGMLKYMLKVTCDATPTIDSEYNGTNVTGSATISNTVTGSCTVGLPIDVNSNFISVTPRWAGAGNRVASCVPVVANLFCKITVGSTGLGVDGTFDILIF